MASSLHDVSCGVPLTVAGRHDGSPDQREEDLAAVRVPSERQRDPRRHVREDVGVVREHDCRRPVRHAAERAGDIRRARPQIGEPDEPERLPLARHADRLVLEHHDPNRTERVADAHAVEPPVVIAEHREGAEGRMQRREHARRVFGGNRPPQPGAPESGDEVPEEHDEIGSHARDGRHDASDLLDADVRRPRVDVGEHRDAEPGELRRPARQRELNFVHDQPVGLDHESPERERQQQRRHRSRRSPDPHAAALYQPPVPVDSTAAPT
jgi:hypothetical protein